jgi:LacI family transcriptional regulator
MTTIYDVANKAGVSPKTVSRVVNDSLNVSQTTRARVLRVIEELNYRPSFAARLMRTGKSGIIGFITDRIASTPFAVDIIKGAQSAAWKYNKLLLVFNSDWDPDVEESAVEALLERGVEGIIYATMWHREAALPTNIRAVPTLLLNCFVADGSLPSVVPDEVGGGRRAAHVLVRKGHKRIAFINLGPPAIAAYTGRLEGFKQELETHGLFDPELVRQGANEASNGYESTFDLMSSASPPTAIFCGSDHIAVGAYSALQELGLRIPDDVAVVGFDNQVLLAEVLKPNLSTIALPHYEMGQWAIQYLLENQDNLKATQKKIECPYVKRESV